MGTIAISGCATGIGAACRKRLEADGHKVVGIDLHHAEVEVDLSSAEGRQRAIGQVLEHSGGTLDRLVLCAGVGGHIGNNSLVASVNYFGVVELLDGFLGALKQGNAPAAVAICSNSAQLGPDMGQTTLVQAMLAGDEPEARRLADEEYPGQSVYMLSKHALGVAVRQRALEWGEAGVRLNAVAPGPIDTPLLQGGLATPGDGDAIRAFKIPLGRFGEASEIAGLVNFMLGPDAAYVHGSVWYMDGGADANVRPDRY